MTSSYDDEDFLAFVDQVEEDGQENAPDYVFLTLAVCAGDPSSRGWQG